MNGSNVFLVLKHMSDFVKAINEHKGPNFAELILKRINQMQTNLPNAATERISATTTSSVYLGEDS